MEDPDSESLTKPHFFQPILAGFLYHLNIPKRFFKKHIEGRHEKKTATLRSDLSHRTWEVKLEGLRFTDGWEDFAVEHGFGVGDFVFFRHEGDMVFHVTRFGPGLCNFQYPSPPPKDNDSNDSDEHETNDSGNLSRRKKEVNNKRRTKTMSSTESFCIKIQKYSLKEDRQFVPVSFTRSNGLWNRRCNIVLKNEHGSSWRLRLERRAKDGMVYLKQGWRDFCDANGLRLGSFCELKVVRKGANPVLTLCSKEPSNSGVSRGEASGAHERRSSKRRATKKTLRTRRASSPSGQDRFVTLIRTENRQKTGQLCLPLRFTRPNGIKKPGKVILLDKNGEEWPSYLRPAKGFKWFYLRKEWKQVCDVNGVKEGESFTLELTWRGSTPVLKFGSEAQQELGDNDVNVNSTSRKRRTRKRVQPPRTNKKARVRVHGRDLDHTDQENRSRNRADAAIVTRGAHAVSDRMDRAKQRITDAITALRHSRELLSIREHDLEASLREFEDLGEEI